MLLVFTLATLYFVIKMSKLTLTKDIFFYAHETKFNETFIHIDVKLALIDYNYINDINVIDYRYIYTACYDFPPKTVVSFVS